MTVFKVYLVELAYLRISQKQFQYRKNILLRQHIVQEEFFKLHFKNIVSLKNGQKTYIILSNTH